jgi:molecular chaperone DnaK (HSP70)
VDNDVSGGIYQALGADPKNTFHSVKRFMGKKFKQVAEDALRVPFEVLASDPVGSAEAPGRGHIQNNDTTRTQNGARHTFRVDAHTDVLDTSVVEYSRPSCEHVPSA